ncbi:MAG: hypothetical protein K6A69_02040 [Lachnospiraceae bacterium]|nr:hypothetical protein [Lachnospiraceae bacterium]
MDDEILRSALKDKKIPVLPLDQKWHRLFAISGKTEEVIEAETELNTLIQKQGELNQNVKEWKKLKSSLMKNIVDNMSGDDENQKNKENNKLMIEELNRKIEEAEDELIDIPKAISEKNYDLMFLTMKHCYPLIKKNEAEKQEIDEWIANFRKELKKQIIRKQNREINNKEIYAYMHDVFGKEVVNLFDYQYTEADEKTKQDKFDKEVSDLNEESKKVLQEEGK